MAELKTGLLCTDQVKKPPTIPEAKSCPAKKNGHQFSAKEAQAHAARAARTSVRTAALTPCSSWESSGTTGHALLTAASHTPAALRKTACKQTVPVPCPESQQPQHWPPPGLPHPATMPVARSSRPARLRTGQGTGLACRAAQGSSSNPTTTCSRD